MSDIFVSYAHEDRPWVTRFTGTLQKAGGWDIWWDRSIAPGEQFDEVIERAITQARVVIVVWSRHSVTSRWVKTEARDAAERGILVPLMIEPLTLPLEFRSFETADMSGWNGELDEPQLLEIIETVRATITRTGGAPAGDRGTTSHSRSTIEVPTKTMTRPAAPAFSRRMGLAVAALLLVVAVAALYGLRPLLGSPDPTITRPVPAIADLPQLTRGTWTLRGAVDDEGQDFSNSVIEFTSQEATDDGLAVKGLITWRRGNRPAGTETIDGYYVASTRQLFFTGRDVTPVDQGDDRLLTAGSYSALLSPDGRSLLQGRWGSTAAAEPGVGGNWEAHR